MFEAVGFEVPARMACSAAGAEIQMPSASTREFHWPARTTSNMDHVHN